MRDAHPKAHGCVQAEFTVNANIPAGLRSGIFAEPKSYQVWIRFSNGAGTSHDDAAGEGRSMAIKLAAAHGKKLLPAEAEAQTQDLVMIDYPGLSSETSPMMVRST